MSKRIISLILAVTMVLSLFGFPLSVSASTDVATYNSLTGGITFTVGGVDDSFGAATVEIRTVGGRVIIQQDFSASAGSTTGTIYAGVLSSDTIGLAVDGYAPIGYVIQVWPAAAGEIIVPVRIPVTDAEYPVVFTAGAGGAIAATVDGTAITSGSYHAVGTSVVFTATPEAGYVVASWTVGGIEVPETGTTLTRAVVAGGLTVHVEFEEEYVPYVPTPDVYVLSVDIDRVDNRRVIPGENIGFAATVLPTVADATISQDVTWDAWTEGGANATITAAGVLQIPANAEIGQIFTVRATSVATNANGQTVQSGVRNVAVVPPDGDDGPGWVDDGGVGPGRPPNWGGIIPPGMPTDAVPPVQGLPPRPDERPPSEIEPTWPITMPAASLLFRDVPRSHWAHDYISRVVYAGLFQGFPDGTFQPDGPFTRSQFVTVIWNLEGRPAGTGTPAFTDIAGHWATDAIRWAYGVGVGEGFPDGTFRPDQPVSRQEMATFLNRYVTVRNINLQSGAATSFTDAGAIGYWAAPHVTAMNAASLIGGFPDGSFGPQLTATRAQAAAIFDRFLQRTR